MRGWVGLWILLQASVALADESVEAQLHAARGNRWVDVLQYEKAIEEYEQAYRADGKALRLNSIAESYDRMAAIAESAAEAVRNKRRALQLYETFLARAPDTDPELEPCRKTAAARIEPLRQEMKALAVQAAERDASLKDLKDAIHQLLIEIRALREQLPRRGQVN